MYILFSLVLDLFFSVNLDAPTQAATRLSHGCRVVKWKPETHPDKTRTALETRRKFEISEPTSGAVPCAFGGIDSPEDLLCLVFLLSTFLFPLSEKSVSTNKNPSKPPVISMPPKAPEDKSPNTHFGVVIHDRGWCRHNRRLCVNLLQLLDSVQMMSVGCFWGSYGTFYCVDSSWPDRA